MDQKKYQELIEKRKKYEDKLENMYRNFRGVIHEDSSSEMKYTQIKVYESFIKSIDEELKVMGVNITQPEASKKV